MTPDGGAMPLAAERSIGFARTLAALIANPRIPPLIVHGMVGILRAHGNRGSFRGEVVALKAVVWFTVCMSLPDAASLEEFSLAELREVVGRLVGEVRRLQSDNTALRTENPVYRA